MYTVQDRDKLWDWATNNLKHIPIAYWKSNCVPQRVSTSPEALLDLVQSVPESIACAEKALWIPEFVRQAIDQNPLVIASVPASRREVLWACDGWNRQTLERYTARGGYLSDLEPQFPPALFTSSAAILDWARCGGFILNCFDSNALEDEDIFVEFARHHPTASERVKGVFERVPLSLVNDDRLCKQLLQETHVSNFSHAISWTFLP